MCWSPSARPPRTGRAASSCCAGRGARSAPASILRKPPAPASRTQPDSLRHGQRRARGLAGLHREAAACASGRAGGGGRNMLPGLIMDLPLMISSAIQYAAAYHGQTEIVARGVDGAIHRYNYAEAERRMKRLANALGRLDVK